MAKAILEFDLNDSEDRDEHNRMLRSLDMVLMVWDFDNYLRGKIKHGELEQGEYKAYVAIREELYSMMNSRNISLDDLVH